MALNVLVVDDSSVMRAMIIKTLKLSGLPVQEVYQASNGEEGLRILEDHWVDLALLDINMPVMSGAEMLDRLRRNPETMDLPVAVVSTEGSETHIAELRAKGAAFVHKPFTPAQLRETVFNLTGVTVDEQAIDGALQGSGYDF